MKSAQRLKWVFCLLLAAGLLVGSWTAVEAVPLFQIFYVCGGSASCAAGQFPVRAHLVCTSDASCLIWDTCNSSCTKIGILCSSTTPSCLDF